MASITAWTAVKPAVTRRRSRLELRFDIPGARGTEAATPSSQSPRVPLGVDVVSFERQMSAEFRVAEAHRLWLEGDRDAELGEPGAEVLVFDAGTLPFRQVECQVENEVSAPAARIEDGAAIGEAAIGGHKSSHHARREVGHLGRFEDVAQLLAVGADVLHERRAGLARNVRQVFDPPPAALDRKPHHVVPGFRRFRAEQDLFAVSGPAVQPPARRMKDQPVEAAIAHHYVAAAAQDENRGAVLSRESAGGAELLRRADLGEIAGGPADFESGVGFEGNAFLDWQLRLSARGAHRSAIVAVLEDRTGVAEVKYMAKVGPKLSC